MFHRLFAAACMIFMSFHDLMIFRHLFYDSSSFSLFPIPFIIISHPSHYASLVSIIFHHVSAVFNTFHHLQCSFDFSSCFNVFHRFSYFSINLIVVHHVASLQIFIIVKTFIVFSMVRNSHQFSWLFIKFPDCHRLSSVFMSSPPTFCFLISGFGFVRQRQPPFS